MSQTIIPRPIAWIVTEDEGIINIAPFSYFMALSSSPATVMVSIGYKADGAPKDTLANIRKHKKCTICMVEEHHLEKMHFSSKSLDKELSEAELFNIETETKVQGYPPMIKNVPVAYFCSFNQEVDLGESNQTIPLILNINEMFVDERAINDKEKISIKFFPVARVGKSYALLSKEIEAPFMPKIN